MAMVESTPPGLGEFPTPVAVSVSVNKLLVLVGLMKLDTQPNITNIKSEFVHHTYNCYNHVGATSSSVKEPVSQTSVDALLQAPTTTSKQAKEETGMCRQVFMWAFGYHYHRPHIIVRTASSLVPRLLVPAHQEPGYVARLHHSLVCLFL